MVGLIEIPTTSREENRGRRFRTDQQTAGFSPADFGTRRLHDANWDTTAVVGYDATSGTWNVVQRYVYSPYGTLTILNADFSTPAAGTQPMTDYLYQGMSLDPVTGLYYERNRNYSPSLGVWTSQDPLQYINGANTYQFVGSDPVGMVDPGGTLRLYPGTVTGPILVGQPTWVKVSPPNIRVPPGATEYVWQGTFKQYLGAKATHGISPSGSIAAHLLKVLIKRLPPVEEVETWASAIENDLTISAVRWLWRLKVTYILREDAWRCGNGKIHWVQKTREILDYSAQWQDQWSGPGSTEGFHPVLEGQQGAYKSLASALRDVVKKALGK